MARPPKNPLLTKTERLLGNLMDMAISQSSRRGAGKEDEVGSEEKRMTVTEMRGVLETSIRWQSIKAKILPEEDEPSEFEGLFDDLHGGTAGTGRRKRPKGGDAASPSNGAAPDSAGLDGSH